MPRMMREYAERLTAALCDSPTFRSAVTQCMITYDDMYEELTPDEVADHADTEEIMHDLFELISAVVKASRGLE